MKALILFPNQLCPKLPRDIERVYLVEHPVFFTNQTKHRPKARLNRLRCAYHRITEMLWVKQHEKKHKVTWCRLKHTTKTPWPTQSQLKGIKEIAVYDPTDDDLVTELNQWSKQQNLTMEVMESPLFLFTKDQLKQYRESK